MAVREVGTAEFHRLSRRSEGKLLVVKFTATWCGPCRRIAPQLEALAHRNADVEFVKVYEHNSRDAIIAAGVRSFPTFHFYARGNKVDECRGANIHAVELRVNQYKALGGLRAGPVMVKLRFERDKPRESGEGTVLVMEEVELEVHPTEGLDIFKFQVLSVTDIEAKDQVITSGDDNIPVDSDGSLDEALRRTGGGVYGNYPVLRVSRRASGGRGGSVERAGPSGGADTRSLEGTVVDLKWEDCCSRTYFGQEPVLQPAYVIREESLLPQSELSDAQKKGKGPEAILVVCKACSETSFVPGRAQLSPAISACAAFVCQSKEACAKGYGTDLFSERADTGSEVLPPGSPSLTRAKADIAAAAELISGHPGTESQQMSAMRQRIGERVRAALAYENPVAQAKARAVLTASDGGESVMKRGRGLAAAEGLSEEEGLARALLSWFKKDFFTWTNKPPCCFCGARGASIVPLGMSDPIEEERAWKASRVELYRCKECNQLTRFPRYNDPVKLLETRNGRCGEWANCFTLLCRAVNLEARHVLDWTDHVWTEIWIPAKNRWVHADPCENKLDKPRMYEEGWNKRLSYVVAFDRDGVVDVTRRYTRRWLEVLSRRNAVPEKWFRELLRGLGASRSPLRTALIASRLAEEEEELKGYAAAGPDDDLDSEVQEGRQSGDAEWIASRGEDGTLSPQELLTDVSSPLHSKRPPCPLVGAPVGILGEGGALTVSVAAVVADAARGSIASILLGGVVVCRAPGRRVLCAAAVSGTRGSLVDSREFELHDEKSCSAVTTWVGDLPDSVVVVLAATDLVPGGSGGAVGSSQWAKTVDMLMCRDRSSEAGGKASSDQSGGDGPSWTLVGWKGQGAQPWTRCQHGAANKGTRCALYLELVFPQALQSATKEAAGAEPPKPAYVELKDRLCVTPLMSIASPAGRTMEDDTTGFVALALEGAPHPGSRGACVRSNEPLVAVGPNVELVHGEGWTTVLRVPAGSESPVPSQAGGGVPAGPSSWRVATVSAAVGTWHHDTEGFDDLAIGCPASVMGGSPVALAPGMPLLPVGRVREIIVWSGDVVNGVQVVYDIAGVTVRGPKHFGDHGLYRQSSIVLDLDAGEMVAAATIRAGSMVDSLHVRTNKGRKKKWGGNGGEYSRSWQAPPGCALVGFHGGTGGHLHSLGLIFVEQGVEAMAGSDNTEEDLVTPSPDDSSQAGPKPRGNEPFLPPRVVGLLYSTDPVSRACAQLLSFHLTPKASEGGGDKTTKGEIVSALETAMKYADNLLASPLDPRVSRIRLGNGFFERKIGKLAGGGGVMRAMGFRLVGEEGRMQYVFRREQAPGGRGLAGLRQARATLAGLSAELKLER